MSLINQNKEDFKKVLPDIINLTDRYGNYCIHVACNYVDAKPENLKLLIEAGADVNARDAAGNTPMMLACSRWNSEIIEILASTKKIDLSLTNKKGLDVLYFIRIYKKEETFLPIILKYYPDYLKDTTLDLD